MTSVRHLVLRTASVVTLGALSLATSACGGSPGTIHPVTPVAPGGGGQRATSSRDAMVAGTLTIPPKPRLRNARIRQYISANTASLVFTPTGGQPTITPLGPGAPNCTAQPDGSTQCTFLVPIALPVGTQSLTQTFTIALYASASPALATDVPLSRASSAITLTAGQQTTLPLTLNGVVQTLLVAIDPPAFTPGQSGTANVTVAARDASGATIVGDPSTLVDPTGAPVKLVVSDNDTSGSTTLAPTPNRPGAYTLTYTGIRTPPATITAVALAGTTKVALGFGDVAFAGVSRNGNYKHLYYVTGDSSFTQCDVYQLPLYDPSNAAVVSAYNANPLPPTFADKDVTSQGYCSQDLVATQTSFIEPVITTFPSTPTFNISSIPAGNATLVPSSRSFPYPPSAPPTTSQYVYPGSRYTVIDGVGRTFAVINGGIAIMSIDPSFASAQYTTSPTPPDGIAPTSIELFVDSFGTVFTGYAGSLGQARVPGGVFFYPPGSTSLATPDRSIIRPEFQSFTDYASDGISLYAVTDSSAITGFRILRFNLPQHLNDNSPPTAATQILTPPGYPLGGTNGGGTASIDQIEADGTYLYVGITTQGSSGAATIGSANIVWVYEKAAIDAAGTDGKLAVQPIATFVAPTPYGAQLFVGP